ncbi:hypothetical protein CLOP_g15312 [Closterium sp. NIES-67]|nr:hypothetical protein CLOP_g15312 [Closterium sp. NIES-67]
MIAECEAFIRNNSFTDVSPPQGVNIVRGKWVFRVKQLPGELPVFKARYCAKGYTQKKGLDFFDTFSPTAKLPTLRTLLDVAARGNFEVHSMDVSAAFLQGDLPEDIFMERPQGFPLPFPPGTVWKLNRPVYGLKQAPREWHKKLKATLESLDFHPSAADPSLFIRKNEKPFFILVYVDDMILVSKDSDQLAAVKQALGDALAMKDLGELKNYLGMEITRDREAQTITLSQEFYVNNVLKRFDMDEAKSVATPLPLQHDLSAPPVPSPEPCDAAYPELIGSLMIPLGFPPISLIPSNPLLWLVLKLAKIADFGLLKQLSHAGEEDDRTRIAGTPGYVDPDYNRSQVVSEKSDVYSFGVVLLELLTAQRTRVKGTDLHICEWATSKVQAYEFGLLKDVALDAPEDAVVEFADIALDCVKVPGSRRPLMKDVARRLHALLAKYCGDGITEAGPSMPTGESMEATLEVVGTRLEGVSCQRTNVEGRLLDS